MIGTVGSFSHASQIHVDWFAFKTTYISFDRLLAFWILDAGTSLFISCWWMTKSRIDSSASAMVCWNPPPKKKATKTAVFFFFFWGGGCRSDSPLPRNKSSSDKFDKKKGGVFQHPWVPKLHKVSQHIYWAWFSLQPHARFLAYWVRELPSVPMVPLRPECYADVCFFTFSFSVLGVMVWYFFLPWEPG